MERKLQERMVGAGVLILALVIVGPMILDGGSGDDGAQDAVPGQRSDELRTHTFSLSQPSGEGPTARDSESIAVPAAADGDSNSRSGMAQQQVALAPAAANGPAPPHPGSAGANVAAAPPAKYEAAPAEQVRNPVIDKPPAPTPPAPSPAARPATAAGGDWLVQVGTFAQKDNAERLTASLKQRGFAAFVSPLSRPDKTLYRVRVGPAGSREAAADVAGKLAAAGQSGQIVAP